MAPSPSLSVEISTRRVVPWCIKVLPEAGNRHSIAVGDSDGTFSVWDGTMGSRGLSLKHNAADIVSMTADPTLESIYCASTDASVTLFQRSKKGQNKWVFVAANRQHTHDVQAVASNKTHMFSAGIDSVVYARAFVDGLSTPGQQMVQFGNRPVAQMFGGNRLLVQLQDSLQVWRLGSAATSLEGDDSVEEEEGLDDELLEAMQPAGDAADDAMDVDNGKSHKKRGRNWRGASSDPKRQKTTENSHPHDIADQRAMLLEIKPQLRQYNHITCSAVSRSGDRIAMSDLNSTRVFYLKRGVGAGGHDSTTSAEDDSTVGAGEDYLAVRGRKTISGPSLQLRISESGQLIRATPEHAVEVYNVKGKPTLLASFDFAANLPMGAIAGPTLTMAVSSDAQWVAVGDSNNNIVVYNLDTLKFHSALPVFDSRHTALAFQPGEGVLAVGLVGNTFLLYDIEKNGLTQWSKNYTKRIPSQLTKIKDDQIYDICFHPEQPTYMVAYTHSVIFLIDLSQRLGKPPKGTKNEDEDRLGLLDDKSSWRLIQRYHPLLFTGFVDGGALAVVERPFRSVLLMLPPPFYRHRFAT